MTDDLKRMIYEGRVPSTLLRLGVRVVPSLGIVLVFNVVDLLFVGQLGPASLAALCFSFPVSLTLLGIAQTLSTSTQVSITRVRQGSEPRDAAKQASTAFFLSTFLAVIVTVFGLPSIEPLFKLLGAHPEIIALVTDYMVPLYFGLIFLFPMRSGFAAIQTTTNAPSPTILFSMVILLNLALDPIFIFGWGPVPRMGLQGAAIATVISWGIGFVATFWIIARQKEPLLMWPGRQLSTSWRLQIKTAFSLMPMNLVNPLASAVLIRLVASFGPDVVAGFVVGQRLESLALIGIMSIAFGAIPFFHRNFPAGRRVRVATGLSLANTFSIGYGLIVAALLALAAAPLSSAFSESPSIQTFIATYLWTVPLSFGVYGISIVVIPFLGSVMRSQAAVGLDMVRRFGLTVPGAWIGAELGGETGLLVGLSVGYALSGALAFIAGSRFLTGPRRWPSGRLW